MTHIDKETIDKIRTSNNIVDVIGSYIPLTEKGKNFFGVCPFHNDHAPSMSVSPEKQIYKCFSCGATGNVFTFLMDYEKISFMEAVSKLGEKCGIKINNNFDKTINPKFKEYFDIYNTSMLFYKNNLNSIKGEKALFYLHERKLSDADIKYFNIGLSLDGKLSNTLTKKYKKEDLINIGLSYEKGGILYDLFNNRIMFPICDLDGNTIGFSGRIYNNEETSKYINTKETEIFKKGKILYNYNNAKDEIRRKKEIIICEGFMDVIRLHTIGIKNAVALMGTSFTDEQLDFIKKLRINIILNLDMDNAGKDAIIRIGDSLNKQSIKSEVIFYEGAKDTDEFILKFGKEKFIEKYKDRINFLDFKINYLKRNINTNNSIELSKYINEVIKTLNDINDDILLNIKVKEISKLYNIDEDVIYSKVNKKTPIKQNKFVNKSSNKILDKYEVSEIRIIYLMLNYPEVIKIYERELGYLPDADYKMFANEIVFFKDKNKGFDYADFITYIEEKSELKEIFDKIKNYNNIDNYTEEELEDYIINIKKCMVKKQIEVLKKKMKESLDADEKLKLAERIEKMKKEVIEW